MSASGDRASGEDSLIARYFRPLATDPGAFNLMDDAAILAASGDDLVITTDAIVEGVHFLPSDPPDSIARKALRVNLSDLAAKGTTPAGFVMTLALRDASETWLAPFARALGEDAAEFNCPILGGDTVSTPGPLMISITAFGRVPSGQMLCRTTARVGDRIFVTGTIGDASLGLGVLQNGEVASALANDPVARDALIARYRIPQPRMGLAKIARAYASSGMDVSDGLAGDLTKLCAASGVSARVQVEAVPLSSAARSVLDKGATSIEKLLAGGDDYEVLCTVPENRCAAFRAEAAKAGVAVTDIGEVLQGGSAPQFVDQTGRVLSLSRLSYSHF
jgi:thiamine-monophosphate kinase